MRRGRWDETQLMVLHWRRKALMLLPSQDRVVLSTSVHLRYSRGEHLGDVSHLAIGHHCGHISHLLLLLTGMRGAIRAPRPP